MTDDDRPLPSSAAAEGTVTVPEPLDDEEDDDEDDEPQPVEPRPRPPVPTFKFSTFVYVFLGLLGFWMILDPSARNGLAGLLGTSGTHPGPLYTIIGFGSAYLLLTMAAAGAIEMLITAVAYNYTTDWVKAAKVQSWSSAFRKVQMAAMRSGKKDRVAALKPHQEKLTRLSGEVSIAQFKGMAITYFLLVLLYTWVGLVIGQASAAAQTISLEGGSIHLMGLVGPVPWWFLIFSLYTIPFSLVFRRILKHVWLQRYLAEHPPTGGGSPAAAVGGTS